MKLHDVTQEQASLSGAGRVPHRRHEGCGRWEDPLSQWKDCYYCAFKAHWIKKHGFLSWKSNPEITIEDIKLLNNN